MVNKQTFLGSLEELLGIYCPSEAIWLVHENHTVHTQSVFCAAKSALQMISSHLTARANFYHGSR